MAGNTHGAITGLSDDFLNTSRNVLDMDMRRQYFQNYAPEGLSFDDFNKAIDSKLYGRGNNMQGSGSFSKLVEAEKTYKPAGAGYSKLEKEALLDEIYPQSAKYKTVSNTEDVANVISKLHSERPMINKLKDAYAAVRNSKIAGLAKSATPALKGAARAAGKFIAPVAAITTAGDLYDLYQAFKSSKNAESIDEQTKQVFKTFDDLKAQGYDERTAWQIANGLPVDNLQQTPQEQVTTQPTNKKVDMKQKMKNEVANDTQNLPQAGGNMEQFINNQIAKYGGYNSGGMNNIPPEGMPMSDGQPMQPQTVIPTPQEQQVQPVVQNAQVPQQVDYAQQIMQMTPQGYVSAQDIMNKLNAAYANINRQIGADPRYQGGVIQANNPYDINEDRLRLAQQAAENYTRLVDPSKVPDVMAQNARVIYEQQMANQLGVPYEDYINAMLDQRKARIASEAQQMENVLKLQAQQATDMKARLDAVNKMQELRNNVAIEMYKADLDAQSKKDVAMLNAVGGIAKTQAFTNAPSTMMQAAGQYAGNVGGVLGGNYMYSNLWAMTPEQRGLFMNAGRPITDEELQVFFGRMGNVPAQFRAQGGQMPVQQAQQQGILPNIAQWVMGN